VEGDHASRLGEALIPVETRKDVETTIDESARGLYFIAATSAIVSLASPPWHLVDAVLIAGLAVWFQRRRSMVAALLLLGLGVVGFAITLTSLFSPTHAGKGSAIVEGVLIWLAARGVLAIRAIPPLKGSAAPSNNGMKRTKPAPGRMARSSPLIPVSSGQR
jgi:hypothetical protein